MKKRLLLGVAAAAVVLMASGSALAAPKADPNITLTFSGCTNPAYNGPGVGSPGNGPWTPAFIGSSTIIPVSFGVFTGSYKTPDGTFPFVDPARTQNAGKGGNHTRVTCTYTVKGTEGLNTFQGSGSVTFFAVGKP